MNNRMSAALGITLLAAAFAQNAAALTFDFTFENDGSLTNPPFGTLSITAPAIDQLQFVIDVNNGQVGIGQTPDDHQFGWMMDFSGPVNLIAQTPNMPIFTVTETPSPPMGNDGKVAGRNSVFDYVAEFGAGQPIIDPVSFTISASGLDLNDILNAGISTQDGKPDAQFVLHVQSTEPDNPGSEAIGGTYSVVPLPAAAWLFGSALLGVAGIGYRRKQAA